MKSQRNRPWCLALLAALALSADSARGEVPGNLMPTAGQLAPLRLAGSVESYTSETLWERINGEAELYRLYGLTQAAIAYFEDPSDGARGIEVSLFRLSAPLGAFGLFATFRGAGDRELPLGNGGTVDDYQGMFWHGEWFVLLHGFGAEGTRAADLQRAGTAIASALGTPPAPPEILSRFSARVRTDSVRFHPDHLFGRAAMPPGLSGTTAAGITLFVTTAPDGFPGEMAAYAETLDGKRSFAAGDRKGIAGRDPDLGPIAVMAHTGRWIGVRGAVPEEELGNLLRGLAEVAEAP